MSISNVTIHDADPRSPSTIAGIPDHNIEDVRISNVRHYLVGGLTPGDAVQDPPELVDAYPENDMFGTLPAFGFFVRHVDGLELNDVAVRFEQADTPEAFAIRDVNDVDLHHVRADKVSGVPTFVLDHVDDFTVTDGRPVAEAHFDHVDHMEL